VELVAAGFRRRIDELIGDLASRFAASGFAFYLVGGVVRDLALGKGVAGDIDITTDALPDRTRSLLDDWADVVWDQGARFGTLGARRNDTMVEVTTHRAERYRADSRKPEVDFSTAVEDDLSRRDFTVNAMAIRLPDWELVDPFGGRADLANGVLRTPIDPAASFTDDPLRMLRAARFCAGYELDPVPELERAMVSYVDRIDIVSRERIAEEMRKFFAVRRPGAGLALLHRTGVLDRIAPIVAGLDNPPIEALNRSEPDVVLRWAVLLWPHAGERSAVRAGLAELRESAQLQREVTEVLAAARALAELPPGADGAVPEAPEIRRLLLQAGSELRRARALLDAVDDPVDQRLWRAVEEMLSNEGVESLRAPLDGSRVMEVIGCEGPVVGEALRFLLERRLDEGPIDEPAAVEMLRTWWADREGAAVPDQEHPR
jgi:poly(A) polymerase